jgi:hypothetical protein
MAHDQWHKNGQNEDERLRNPWRVQRVADQHKGQPRGKRDYGVDEEPKSLPGQLRDPLFLSIAI